MYFVLFIYIIYVYAHEIGLVVIAVLKGQFKPDLNMYGLCAVCVIQAEVTAWSSRGWN